MQDSQSPQKFSLVWASSATSSYITNPVPTTSQIGITNGAASLADGFPPLTFIPLSAGGAGPYGKDFNGIFNQITAWNQWTQAGGPVIYDSTFQTAIGGYPRGAIVASATLYSRHWLSTVDNNVSNPDTGGVGWIQFGSVLYQWDAGVNPPSNDIMLLIGDRAIISYTNRPSIPLFIQTATPGFYRITMVTHESNTINADVLLAPNNTTYTAAFNTWAIENSDFALGGFGSATTPETRINITNWSNFPGGVGNVPFSESQIGATVNYFTFDLFGGPVVNSPNDIGPWMLELVCSTTVGKLCRGIGGVQGGPSIQFGKWNDTITPWTSLGTISDKFASSISGLITIERLA